MMDENEKKETEQEKDTYSWVLRFDYSIEIAQEYKIKPRCSSLKKQLEKAIDEVVEQYNDQYRVYDYSVNISDVDDDVELEIDME